MKDYEEEEPVETDKDSFSKATFRIRLLLERAPVVKSVFPGMPELATLPKLPSVTGSVVFRKMAINQTHFALEQISSIIAGPANRQALLEEKWRREFEEEQPGSTPATASANPVGDPGRLIGASGSETENKLVKPELQNSATPSTFRDYKHGNNVSGVFKLAGKVWTLSYLGTTIHLPNSAGLGHIAVLLRTPSMPVEAAQLDGRTGQKEYVNDPGLPACDDKTLRDVGRELQQTSEQLKNLPSSASQERTRLEEKRARCEIYLRGKGALGGQVRKAGGASSKARSRVTNAINRALVAIGEPHPTLALHLKKSVRTGARLSYEPESPVAWTF
jgi:hypothetical protein